jgi:hypothetical protein
LSSTITPIRHFASLSVASLALPLFAQAPRKITTPKEAIGFNMGDDYMMANYIAAAQANVGKGNVLLFGPEIAFRGQPYATFKFLFNGLLYGPANPEILH